MVIIPSGIGSSGYRVEYLKNVSFVGWVEQSETQPTCLYPLLSHSNNLTALSIIPIKTIDVEDFQSL